MQVFPGEVVGLIGPSGSGKSTLLKCLGAVIEPTSGRMTLGGEVIYDNGWKIPDLRALRRDKIDMAVQYETAIIVVTHDEKIIPTFKRIYRIRDGKTQEEAGEGQALNSIDSFAVLNRFPQKVR
jgi:ABC-type lipoprotein export system ATPase subunit